MRTALGEGRGGDGKGKDVFGEGWNARKSTRRGKDSTRLTVLSFARYVSGSRVHEYGGGAFTVVPDTDEVLFSNVKDGRIWRVARDSTEPVALTAGESKVS